MAIEPEPSPPEVIVEDEPRYLRRQKPVEIRRRRFGRRSWQNFRRWVIVGVSTVMGGAAFYGVAHFFLFSPRVLLTSPDQILLTGNHYVSRAAVLEKFLPDRGRSVLRVPLEERRRAIEDISWVEQAAVERLLPNRIRVELVERAPVAFLRLGADLALIDAYGVILDRPSPGIAGEFRFPVVAGLSEALPRDQREQRMQLFTQFVKEIDVAKPGASEHVSEVDLSDAKDVRATLTGIASLTGGGAADQEAVLVHFGESDFGTKIRLLAENFSQWRAGTGRVDSVDLRFARQVVVNPEGNTTASDAAQRSSPAAKAR
jgi:cell division protein FtsQ